MVIQKAAFSFVQRSRLIRYEMSVEIITLAGVLLCIALCSILIMKACKHDYKIRIHDIGHKSAIVHKCYKDH